MSKLLQFTVGNYRSFNIKRTFTFVPTPIKDEPKDSVIRMGKYRFSTVSAIYGANSSGKSNLADSIAMMNYIIRHSVKLNDKEELPYDPFVLSSSNETNKPTHFEAVYLNNVGEQVRYGFENDSKRILKEWLFIKSGVRERVLFVREEDGIAVNEELFGEGKDREEMTNDNRLFLSLVAQVGGTISKDVMSFFQVECNVISGIDNAAYGAFTKHQFKVHDSICDDAMKFFRELQFGFTDIDVEEREIDLYEIPEEFRPKSKPLRLEVFSSHNIYDAEGRITGTHRFKFAEHESNGTQKMFELAGPIFDTLKCGGILIVDELDAKMHPLISQQIVRLFTDITTNPHHAQLLFTTHDTNLLSAKLMRRDQIWFTEKDSKESSDLYRLSDIVFSDGSKPRGDGNIERNYIRGRYGAIPFITSNLY